MPAWQTGGGPRVDKAGHIPLLVLCASAQRAVNLVRVLRPMHRLPVAKLFGKHLKVAEQQESLRWQKSAIAVGTPNRVMKLVEAGALSLEGVFICLDANHKDLKNYSLLTLPGVSDDLFSFFTEHVYPLEADDTDGNFSVAFF
uniref:Uncharacterized protein n=1 Tax=Octactis speculum TaxID=3111310 RepID=A0A7S2DD59_9STRA|mmetsp:Transcript_47173/g.64234  ORF Transcript_47173/g.64234 Transcript_47173/m.64234 type:complete len:143 (+) Transcript_47173:74-502(+)